MPLPAGTANAITKAAGYLAQNGPVSGPGRGPVGGEPGREPLTIGLEIVALLVAATRLTGPEQALALALADNWNERMEEFTYVSGDEVDQAFGTDGHYVRIGLSGGGRVALANQPQGTHPVDAAALVGLEFGYLPRLGLRDPADKRVTDTLAIVEAMLGADTPAGAPTTATTSTATGNGWTAAARPSASSASAGHGRCSPANGATSTSCPAGTRAPSCRRCSRMRGRGGLLPEQVWDAGQAPGSSCEPGQPTGSAMPLAWAHSELIKLAVAVTTKKPVELLTLVSDRYRAAVPASQSWFWRDATPVCAARRQNLVVGAQPVHPALRLRRLGPRHHRRTRRSGSLALVCSGSPWTRPTRPGTPACNSSAATRTAAGNPPPATMSRWAPPGPPPSGCQPATSPSSPPRAPAPP